MEYIKEPDIDKLLHSSVGLGIKLSSIYIAIAQIITIVVYYYFGLICSLISTAILPLIIIYRGAWFAGYIKELIDKYIRKTKFDMEDVKATQNSNIVLDLYKKLIK